MADETVPSVKNLVNPYEMQWYLELYEDGKWTGPERVTELNEVEHEADPDEYETEYLDRKKQTKYVMSVTEAVTFEVDAVGPGGLQQLLASHEGEYNLTGRIVRTLAYDFAKGEAAPATALVAKRALCSVNVEPLTQDGVSDPVKMSVSVTLTEDWAKGTFDSTSNAFTEAAA